MTELYLFDNNGSKRGFTPTVFSKSLGGIVYEPVPVKRSNINLTDNFAKIPVTLEFDRANSYILSLVQNTPENPIKVTIFKNNIIYWEGRVMTASVSGAKVSIVCDSIITSLKRNGLHTKYTLTCRHVLYSPDCAVVKALHGSLFSNISATSSIITVPTLISPTGTYDRGIAEMSGQSRSIISQVGNTVTLAYAFSGNLIADLTLYPGCDLTTVNCITPFNNLNNFGGFPFIPTKNPFDSGGLF